MDFTMLALIYVFENFFHRNNLKDICIFRLWVGYGFDGAEFTAAALTYGFVYSNVEFMYIFYVYIGLLVVAAVVFSVLIKMEFECEKIAIIFFKITSTFNAAFVFFQLYLQHQREDLVYFLLVVTGIDMCLDFLGFAYNCATIASNNKIYPF